MHPRSAVASSWASCSGEVHSTNSGRPSFDLVPSQVSSMTSAVCFLVAKTTSPVPGQLATSFPTYAASGCVKPVSRQYSARTTENSFF